MLKEAMTVNYVKRVGFKRKASFQVAFDDIIPAGIYIYEVRAIGICPAADVKYALHSNN